MDNQEVTTQEQSRQVVRRWILGVRVTFLVGADICLVKWVGYAASRLSAQECQNIQHITGSPGGGCGSDTAINVVGIAGLVLAVLFVLSLTLLRLPRPPEHRRAT